MQSLRKSQWPFSAEMKASLLKRMRRSLQRILNSQNRLQRARHWRAHSSFLNTHTTAGISQGHSGPFRLASGMTFLEVTYPWGIPAFPRDPATLDLLLWPLVFVSLYPSCREVGTVTSEVPARLKPSISSGTLRLLSEPEFAPCSQTVPPSWFRDRTGTRFPCVARTL